MRMRVETLIFDEIDSGISGRTAQMVSEKMNVLGRSHQIICIHTSSTDCGDGGFPLPDSEIRTESDDSLHDPQTVGGGEHTGAFPYAWRRGDHGDGKRECARDARLQKSKKSGV